MPQLRSQRINLQARPPCLERAPQRGASIGDLADARDPGDEGSFLSHENGHIGSLGDQRVDKALESVDTNDPREPETVSRRIADGDGGVEELDSRMLVRHEQGRFPHRPIEEQDRTDCIRQFGQVVEGLVLLTIGLGIVFEVPARSHDDERIGQLTHQSISTLREFLWHRLTMGKQHAAQP